VTQPVTGLARHRRCTDHEGAGYRSELMAKARPQPWTIEEFLAFEAEEPERYEFVDGIIRMMTGGSAAHSAIKGNMFAELRAALRSGPCRVDVDDLKVVTETAVMYPDILVICRPMAPDDDRVADPTVVVEVLSPTTETHDRIRKWRQYQTIASLQHFVLIAQSERRIEVYTRERDGWQLTVVEPPEDAVALKAVGARLSLAALYEGSGR
jgi:Uma2 family endonuclease